MEAYRPFPAIGQALAIGSVAPEAVYLAKMQVDITLMIALIYNSQLNPEDVQIIMVACYVLALGTDFIKKEIKEVAIVITKELMKHRNSLLKSDSLDL